MDESNKLIYNINEKPKRHEVILYSIQHCLAMFVATALISILIYGNFDMVPAAIISAGVGTIIYALVTRFKSPVFLGSSAALMPIMSSCLFLGFGPGDEPGGNYIALIIGLTVVGIVYFILSILVRKFGIEWLHKLIPSVVIGPVIILIGLGLAGFATSWSMYNSSSSQIFNEWSLLVAIITMLVVVILSHYAKGLFKTLPFLVAIIVGYICALGITGIGHLINNADMRLISFTGKLNWIPKFSIVEACKGFEYNHFEWNQLPKILIVAIPVSFVAFCEHIGDHLNLSSIVQKDLLEEPGLHRTAIGDGIATAVGGLIGGMGNTTYGENVSVVGITKVASIYPIIGAAILSILLGLFAPLMWWVQTIPYCVFGGCAIVLYGFIAISGLRELSKINLYSIKNTLIAAVILICGVGGLFIPLWKGFDFKGVSMAMIFGIILNLILKERE